MLSLIASLSTTVEWKNLNEGDKSLFSFEGKRGNEFGRLDVVLSRAPLSLS